MPGTIQNALHVLFLLLTLERRGPDILIPITLSKKLRHRGHVAGYVVMKQLRCGVKKLTLVGLPSKPYSH